MGSIGSAQIGYSDTGTGSAACHDGVVTQDEYGDTKRIKCD